MKSIFTGAVIAFVLLPAAASAQEDKPGFSTSVDLNYKHLDMTVVTGNVVNQFKPNLWTLNLSPSLSWHGFFLSVAFERSLGEGSTSGMSTNNVGTLVWADRRYSRNENYLTLGYRIWGGLSVFGGYLDSSTRTSATNTPVTAVQASTSRSDYKESGLFYGLGYSHGIGEGKVLSASVAQADAKGTFDVTNVSTSGGAPFSATETTSKGDVTGASYGLFLSGPLTGSLYYRLGYKATRYDFKFVATGVNRNTKQNYDAFVLGVVNYF